LLLLRNAVPPVEAAYQSITEPAVVVEALMTTVPVPQRELATPFGVPGNGFTVATTAVRASDTSPEEV
jgi:hypothetical protein